MINIWAAKVMKELKVNEEPRWNVQRMLTRK